MKAKYFIWGIGLTICGIVWFAVTGQTNRPIWGIIPVVNTLPANAKRGYIVADADDSTAYLKWDGTTWRPLGGGGRTASFTTSDIEDTVLVSGVTTNSVFILSIKDATPVANDLLSWTVAADTLFVHRPAGTTSGLTYSYVWER